VVIDEPYSHQVWALAVSSNDRIIVSGAADSVITFWEDCTEAGAAEKENKRAELVVK
jgi:U3 small nucleolar RNA-associated protein 13